ncbi:MAG: relaxase [Pseudomonadota bacterium]
MILKASERGYASNLARHLMNAKDNEHVELHELRGFASDTLMDALRETEAISRGTRCKNFLFSLSLSPPEQENVSIEVFEKTIASIEQRLGLTGQPRAIVFHEKHGRRHAHAVWSRIDPMEMKAIKLSHFKRKLTAMSRELYLEHGWDMPDGLKEGRSRDPLNFSLAEWQQAKRAGRDPKRLKAQVQDAWHRSDNAAALDQALKSKGLFLAKGDRRGFVVVDYTGEAFSLARLSGVRAKELKARLGDAHDFKPASEVQHWLAGRMSEMLERHVRELEEDHAKDTRILRVQRQKLITKHRDARAKLKARQTARWDNEARDRASRLPRGLKGLWSWMTGKLKKIRADHVREVEDAKARDRKEREEMIFDQLAQRRKLEKLSRLKEETIARDRDMMREDIVRYLELGENAQLELEHMRRTRTERKRTTRERGYDGPERDM